MSEGNIVTERRAGIAVTLSVIRKMRRWHCPIRMLKRFVLREKISEGT